MKQVDSVVYLRCTIHSEGNSKKEIAERIGLAKKVFGGMVQILKKF